MAPNHPMITAAAVLPRQNDAQFIGYISLGTAFSQQYSAASCNAGLSFYIDSRGFAGCCPTTASTCFPATFCGNGIISYAPSSGVTTLSTQPCTRVYGSTDTVCNTAFIFENTADTSPKTDIFCGPTALRLSVYRSINTATVGSIASATLGGSGDPNSASASPTNSGGSGGGGGGKGGSKAWIAGAVIGPLVGLALIAGLIFFFLRKKKTSHTAPQTGGAAMGGDPSAPPAGVGGYTDAKPDAYAANQAAYNPHHSYAGAPVSPVPGYANPAGPGSPPPNSAYPQDVKYAHNGAPTGTHVDGPAEMGGESVGHSGPAARPAPAEMG